MKTPIMGIHVFHFNCFFVIPWSRLPTKKGRSQFATTLEHPTFLRMNEVVISDVLTCPRRNLLVVQEYGRYTFHGVSLILGVSLTIKAVKPSERLFAETASGSLRISTPHRGISGEIGAGSLIT